MTELPQRSLRYLRVSESLKRFWQDPEHRKERSELAKSRGYGKWMKGRRNSPDTEFGGKNRVPVEGEKHGHWKGDRVLYGALHKWVRRILGRPKKCGNCGKVGKENNGGKWSIHWANKSLKYARNLTDWIPLCPSCHLKRDSQLNKINGISSIQNKYGNKHGYGIGPTSSSM